MADLNDFQKPDLTSAYSSEVLQTLIGNINRVAIMDPGTASSIPVGFVKLSSGTFSKWDGSSWTDVSLSTSKRTGEITYDAVDLTVKTVTNASGAATVNVSQTTLAPTIYTASGFLKIAVKGLFDIIVGSRSADYIYVCKGSSVDLTATGSGTDVIYLTGSWDSYTKTVTSETITFSRLVDGMYERVKVSGMSGSGNDKLVFADGSVLSSDARSAIALNANCLITSIAGYDSATKTASSPDASFSVINSAIPVDKLLANGQLVSRAAYPNLFAKIGVSFGAGDGSTTFQLPTIAGPSSGVKAFISI